MKILLAGGIIDFYVNKKKYEKFRTKVAKFNYVYSELSKILKSLKGTMPFSNIDLREVSIISNNFWGEDDFCIINDIGYCENNKMELNEKFTTLRIFQIDIVGVVADDFKITEAFEDIQGEGYNIMVSSTRLV